MYRSLVFVHRWSGIIAAALLIVAGVTGSALAFRGDLDRWLNPEMLVVAPRGEALGADALVARVQQRYPEAVIGTVTPGAGPDSAWTFFLAKRPAGGAGAGEMRAAPFSPAIVYVDPYSGEITGTRNRGEFRLDRANLLGVLFEIHHDLFLGLPGHWILGIASAVWILLSLIGIYLAIKQGGGLRRAFAVDLRGNVRRVLLDLHRSLGLISVVAVIAVALSGIYLNLRQEFTAVVQWFSPVSAPPERGWPNRPVTAPAPVGVEQAIAAAEKSMPGARAQSVAINGQKAFYRVRLLQAGDRYERGDTNVYVSMQDGAILETRSLFGDTAGDAFLGWQRPLHTGEVFGVTGKLIVLVLGLVPVFLGASGIYLWLWRKLRGRRAQTRQARAPSGAGISVGAGSSRISSKRT